VLPKHLKAHVCRELDRLELLLEQIKVVEAERDALLAAEREFGPLGRSWVGAKSSWPKLPA